MYYIIYLSAATQLMNDETLKEILLVSNENNRRQNVTGMLLYSDGNIIQVLEGDRQTVKSLYTKISYDSRHHSIIKISEGEITDRSFPDWSMGFRTVSANEFSQIPGYKQINQKSFLNTEAVENEPDTLTFLRVFYKSNINRF